MAQGPGGILQQGSNPAIGIPVSPFGYQPDSNVGRLLMQQYKDARGIPLLLLIPLIITVFALVAGIILSLVYIIILIVMTVKEQTVSAPLNIQTVDYNTISSLGMGGTFNYLYFIVLPAIALGGISLFGVLSYYFPPKNPLTGGVKSMIVVLALASLFVLVLQILFTIYVGGAIRNTKRKLDTLNNYMCSKIYKNIKFLNYIKEPKTTIISIDNTMQAILKDPEAVPDAMPVEDMAKLFYTLSIFNHYHKIGLRNDEIFKAFNIFQPTVILSGSCYPADYLTRYGTYIEDISDNTIRMYLRPAMLDRNQDEIDEAIGLCNEWITETSSKANTLYPEDSYTMFLIMAVITILVQVSSLIIMKYAYGDPKTSKVTAVIQKVFLVVGLELGDGK